MEMSKTKETEQSCPEKKADGSTLRDQASQPGYQRNPFQLHGLLNNLERSTTDRKNIMYLVLISIILFVVPIFFIDLQSGDEYRVAGIAAEMVFDGNILTPKLNGSPFLEYPPLYYVSAAVSYRLFGIIPFAAKLPSALSALAGVLLIYSMMRLLHRPKWEAFTSAFMLATGAQYLTNSYDCRVDMMLNAFCILAWTGFALMEFSGSGTARRLSGMVVLAAGIAGGVLTKNLPGMVIPLSGIGVTLLLCDLANRRFSFCAYCRLAGAALLGILPYAIYLWLLYSENGMTAVETILVYNNFGRFSGSHRDHSSPCWHYLLRLPELFPPYLPFLLGGMFLRLKSFRRARSSRSILLLSLLLIPFLMLSAASGKRMVYLLPLAAPAAMIAAPALPYLVCICQRLFRRDLTGPVCRWIRIFLAVLIAATALIAGFIGHHQSHRDSYAPAFAEAQRRLRTIPGGTLVLVHPSERLSGAAVFYCRAITPQIREWHELKPGNVALASIRSKEPVPPLPEGFAARRFSDANLLLVSPMP